MFRHAVRKFERPVTIEIMIEVRKRHNIAAECRGSKRVS